MFSKKSLLAGIYFICLVVYFLVTKTSDEKDVDLQEPACREFQSNCHVMIDNQEYAISFDRDLLTPEQSFSIFLQPRDLSSTNISQFSGFMEGITMYMGKIPLVFQKISEDIDNNQGVIFKATTVLGSCSEEKMTWRIWLGETDVKSELVIHSEQLINKAYIDVVAIKK